MKVLLVLAVCVTVLGFWRGWFSLSSHGRDGGSNKVNVNLTMDPDKMQNDAEKLKEKTADLANKVTE